MDPATLRLIIFSFIISITFPTLAYTFTTFGDQPTNFDPTLTPNQLINAGVILSDAETHEVSFLGAVQEYEVKNNTMRVEWRDPTLGSPYIGNLQQTFIERILGTWWYPILMDIVLNPSAGSIPGHALTNATIVNNFDTQYNWTKYTIVENSLMGFITSSQDDNNITKAIYETGLVNVTIASEIFESDTANLERFANWYIKVVTGQGGDWGLPSFMTWIMRVFSFMTLLSGVLLAKEFIPFLN